MCSEFFRIPIRCGSVPIFGFGAVLAAWLLASVWAMRATAKSHGWSAASRAHLPTIVIVAVVIAIFLPRYFPDGVPIRGYGVMILAGSAVGISMAIHRARQAGIGDDDMISLAVAMFLCGLVGGRLFYVIEYWNRFIRQSTAWETLKAALSYTEGGLVIYGALFGGVAAFVWYVRRRKLPLLAMADLIAPSLVAGLALGRIGCFLNGCCYGGESNLPWAVSFPQSNAPKLLSPPYADQAGAGRFHGFRLAEETHGKRQGQGRVVIDRVDPASPAEKAGVALGDVVTSINGQSIAGIDDARQVMVDALRGEQPVEIRTAAGAVRTIAAVEPPRWSLPVHPTQIYSAIDAGILAWVLWSFYPFRRREGQVTALMLTIHPITRFLLESIRVDEPAVFGTGLTISQNLSIAIFVVALCLWGVLLKKPAGELAFPLRASQAA